jgi:hypothetical protein
MDQFVVVVVVVVVVDRRSNSYSQGIIINYLSTRCNLSGSSSRSINSSMYVIAIYVVLIDKSYRNRKHHRPPHEGCRIG